MILWEYPIRDIQETTEETGDSPTRYSAAFWGSRYRGYSTALHIPAGCVLLMADVKRANNSPHFAPLYLTPDHLLLKLI